MKIKIRPRTKFRGFFIFNNQFVVEHKSIYGILSKGIHELSEEECLEIFPIVKIGIELILDEKIELEERERKKKENSKNIQKLREQISK